MQVDALSGGEIYDCTVVDLDRNFAALDRLAAAKTYQFH